MWQCDKIRYLLSEMSKLSDLHTLLGRFRVGWPSSIEEEGFDDVAALLGQLKGRLFINIVVPQNEHYIELSIHSFSIKEAKELEGLEELRILNLEGWRGATTMPSWTMNDNLIPNMVKLQLIDCDGLEVLPSLGRELKYLKELVLKDLPRLEYVENDKGGLELFPCLEIIRLENMAKLRGWWRRSEPEEVGSDIPLNVVRLLQIYNCPELTSFPVCPGVVLLYLYDTPRRLPIILIEKQLALRNKNEVIIGTDSLGRLKKWRLLGIENATELFIRDDEGLECLAEVGELFWTRLSSLRRLSVAGCLKMKSLDGAVEYLPVLEDLHLIDLPELEYLSEETVQCLTSLKSLQVRACSQRLRERCQDSTGEYWHRIKNIPNLSIL